MDYKIERLCANDYDELLNMLNTVFHKPADDTFDMFLPVMWERDDEHMSKHIAIKQNGKISSVAGIYPLPAKVNGEDIVFSTIGNVATLPECEGRGMMSTLMSSALEEAKAMGIDVARLGGNRQRYNRFGFERAGVDYMFILESKNVAAYYGSKNIDGKTVYNGSALSGGAGFERKLSFKQVTLDTADLLDGVMALQKNAPLYADRGDKVQFFKTLSAYHCKIWGAFDEKDMLVGYMCATSDGTCIYEHRAVNVGTEYQMLLEWILESGAESLDIHTAPWECELIRRLSKICAKWVLSDTSMFHVFSWSKVLDVLLKIKSEYSQIPDGSFVLKIEGYGTVELSGNGCTDTNKEPMMTLGHLEATRFLLGSIPPTVSSSLPDELDSRTRNYIQSVLPLPLWWCNQDRV